METVHRSVQSVPVATAADFVELLRPRHWLKNIVIYAGPAAALKLSHWGPLLDASLAFAAFCLASSAVYAFNDTLDRDVDARHPEKRNRPVARGAIRPSVALFVAGALALTSVLISLAINSMVTAVLVVYIVINVAYSVALKERVLLDVILIAVGFVLRAWAGTLAAQVPASDWLVACVFTLCLFMGFGKRRCEVVMIGQMDEARQHRKTLVRYTPQLLTHLITVSAGIAVITFLLYTLDTSGRTSPFHKQHLFYTLPIVVYGIFRFAMLTELGLYTGPTEMIFKDRALLLAFLLWVVCAMVIAYQVPLFGPQGLEGLLRRA